MIHEESCQRRTKMIASDLLPDVNQTVGAAGGSDKLLSDNRKPSTLQIETLLITPD